MKRIIGKLILIAALLGLALRASAQAYTASDLGGYWDLKQLYVDHALGFVGYVTGDGPLNGTFYFTSVHSTGSIDSGSGPVTAEIDVHGLVTVHPTVTPAFTGWMNEAKDIIVSSNNADGNFNHAVLVKRAASYCASDLAGTWHLQDLFVDKDLNYVGHTTGTGPLNGNFDFVTVDSGGGGGSGAVSITTTIESNGRVIITPSTSPAFRCWMNASKDLIVSANNANGDFNHFILVKEAAPYVSSNLDGVWHLQDYFVDDDLNFVGQTTGSGPLNGTFAFESLDSGGGSDSGTISVTTTVNAIGQVTINRPPHPSFVGWMNASRNLIVSSHNVDGDFNHPILVKEAPATPEKGPPVLVSVNDGLSGTAQLQWWNSWAAPAQFLGFAWDVYRADWVLGGWNNTLWHPFSPANILGDIPIGLSGAYHVWISSQYADASLHPCYNPWSGIMYSGTPHRPRSTWVKDFGGGKARLHWIPEVYGTWHYQIAVCRVTSWDPFTVDWIAADGPSGTTQWHFIDYGGLAYNSAKASYFGGWADFNVPPSGPYYFYIRAAGWLPPTATGEFAKPFIQLGP